jgi:hypothetical protein
MIVIVIFFSDLFTHVEFKFNWNNNIIIDLYVSGLCFGFWTFMFDQYAELFKRILVYSINYTYSILSVCAVYIVMISL